MVGGTGMGRMDCGKGRMDLVMVGWTGMGRMD